MSTRSGYRLFVGLVLLVAGAVLFGISLVTG